MAIGAYYWWEWRTFDTFVSAIDHGSQFMQDFVDHYYPMGKQILQDPTPVFRYFYSAFFALLLAPICALTLPHAMVAWGVIQFASLAVLCVLSTRGLLKLSPLGGALFVGMCVSSFPILHNIKWGQVSVPITMCVMAAFYASKKEKRILAGALLAFAAAIKFYPALFITYFVLKRDARVCLSFILAVFALYCFLPALILGPSDWLAFEKSILAATGDAADWAYGDPNSQYAAHVWLRWFSLMFHRPADHATVEFFSIISHAIALSCIMLIWRLQRIELHDKCTLSMVALFLSIPFILKTSWPHYFVFLPLCQVAVFSHCASSRCNFGLQKIGLCSLAVFSMLLSSVFVFNQFPDWRVYNGYGVLFVASALLLIPLYAIALRSHGVVNQSNRVEPQ